MKQLLLVVVVVLLSACGPVQAQPSDGQSQPMAMPTDDPNVFRITELPDGGVSIPMHIGTQSLLNTNRYDVGIQCDVAVPAPGEVIPAGNPHPGFGETCPEVILWKVRN